MNKLGIHTVESTEEESFSISVERLEIVTVNWFYKEKEDIGVFLSTFYKRMAWVGQINRFLICFNFICFEFICI